MAALGRMVDASDTGASARYSGFCPSATLTPDRVAFPPNSHSICPDQIAAKLRSAWEASHSSLAVVMTALAPGYAARIFAACSRPAT
jgi:hypothetical protein